MFIWLTRIYRLSDGETYTKRTITNVAKIVGVDEGQKYTTIWMEGYGDGLEVAETFEEVSAALMRVMGQAAEDRASRRGAPDPGVGVRG